MLDALGVGSLEELVDRAVPDTIRDRGRLALPPPLSEAEALTWLRPLADRNQVFTSLIGQGYSNTFTPPVIGRNVLENPAWYTAYTPYQPEISQGRLEALLNFQTMVSDLTGMDMANASLLDEPTAAAEAMAMLHRVNGDKANVFFVDHECHPQTIDVVRTRAEPVGIEVVVGDPHADVPLDGVFGVLLQYPGTTGVVRDDRALVDKLPLAWRAGRGCRRLARARAAHPAGGVGCRRGGGFGAALRRADGLRRSARRVLRHARRVPAERARPPGRGVGRRRRAGPRCASRSRRASSTSGGRRPPATSAPRRCCSPTSRVCTRCTTAPRVCAPSPQRVHQFTRALAAGLPVRNESFFDTISVRVASADDTLARAREAQDQPAEDRRRDRGHRARRDHHHRGRSSTAGDPRCRPRPAAGGDPSGAAAHL